VLDERDHGGRHQKSCEENQEKTGRGFQGSGFKRTKIKISWGSGVNYSLRIIFLIQNIRPYSVNKIRDFKFH
jgi:hypothetical protein